MAYVRQEQDFYPFLTVRETLLLKAGLRLHRYDTQLDGGSSCWVTLSCVSGSGGCPIAFAAFVVGRGEAGSVGGETLDVGADLYAAVSP